MQKGTEPVVRLFITLMLTIISVCFRQARAECSFINPNADPTVMFTMPVQTVAESDAAVGTVTYSGEAAGGSHGLSYDDNKRVYDGRLVLTDTDYSGVLPGVYGTAVPGIGFRVARTENKTATFTSDNLITPQHYIGKLGSWASFDSTYHAGVELVVIDTVQSSMLDANLLNVDYQMGNLIVVKLRFGPTVVDVLTDTCNLVSKDVAVLMDLVTSGSLSQEYSSILADDSFKIGVADCITETYIDYKFTSVGSTGVTDGNILDIISGEGAASGVGTQIFDKDNHVLSFDQEYTGTESAIGRGTEETPLETRCVKAGAVKRGQVGTAATFEVYHR